MENKTLREHNQEDSEVSSMVGLFAIILVLAAYLLYAIITDNPPNEKLKHGKEYENLRVN